MVRLAPLDVSVVLLFVGALFALGFSARLRQSSALQFLAAGRALSLPAFVATLVCTWYGGILGIGESASYYGVGTWVLLGLPYYAFGLVYALTLARRVREAAQISIPERLERAYGRTPALIGAGLVFLLAVPAAHVLMLGVLAHLITGWDLALCVPAAAVLGSLFLYKGGLLADVRVSLLAFAMMYVGFAAMAAWSFRDGPIWQQWASLPPAMLTWDGGSGWVTVGSFFVLGAWTLVDPGFHQRVASAASPEIGRRGLFVAVACWFVFDLLSISTALSALASGVPTREPLGILPLFAERELPPGLKAVFLCGMLGTILTAMVGYTLVAGATAGREIAARAARQTDEGRITTLIRAGMALATAVAVALALSVGSVVNLWYQWGGAVVGALLLPVWTAYRRPAKPPSDQVVAASMVLSFGVAAGWMAYGHATGNPFLEIAIGSMPKFGLGTLLPGLVVSAVTIGAGTLRRPIEENR